MHGVEGFLSTGRKADFLQECFRQTFRKSELQSRHILDENSTPFPILNPAEPPCATQPKQNDTVKWVAEPDPVLS